MWESKPLKCLILYEMFSVILKYNLEQCRKHLAAAAQRELPTHVKLTLNEYEYNELFCFQMLKQGAGQTTVAHWQQAKDQLEFRFSVC